MKFFPSPFMIDKSTFFFSHFLVFFEQIINFFLFLFLSSPPFFYFIILFLFYFLLSFSAPSFFFARFSYTQKETSSPPRVYTHFWPATTRFLLSSQTTI